MQHATFSANIFVVTVLTDLLDRYHDIMSITVSNCQHCDEQQFRTLSCVHYTIFLVVNLDLFIRARTVIRSESCYGKNYVYASRTSCFIIIIISLNWFNMLYIHRGISQQYLFLIIFKFNSHFRFYIYKHVYIYFYLYYCMLWTLV